MNFKFSSIKLFLPVFLSFLFAVSLAQIPLTDILHYEYSVVFSIINYFISAFVFFSGSTYSKLNFNKYIILILVNLIPLLTSFLLTYFSKSCNPILGVPFYLVFVVSASFISWTIAAFSEFQSAKYRSVIFIALTTFIFIEPVIEIYFLPQIYFYNPVITFFPGTIYDEDISLTSKIITYRIFIIAIYSAINFLIRHFGIKLRKLLIIILAYFLFASQFFIKAFTPFQTSIKDIENCLGGKLSTEHFTIYYPKELNENKILILREMHEFYYNEVKNVLKDDVDGKITSFIFRSNDEKREMFGAGNADVAKPWSKQIFMEIDYYDKVIKHELVHIFSRKYGKTIFMVADNFNPALIEGFATAIDNNFRNEDLFYSAYLLGQAGYPISFELLFDNLNFFGHLPSVGYLYSGAFIRYLLQQYGVGNIKKLYSNLDFQEIYGKNIKSLEKEYYEFIRKKNFVNNRYKSQLYFSGLPLIKKSCAHEVSLQLKDAGTLLASGQSSKAALNFKKIYYQTNNFEALAGYVDAMIHQKRYKLAINLLNREITKVKESGFYFYLKFKLGDLNILNGYFIRAEEIFTEILNMNLNFSYNIQSSNRLCMLKQDLGLLQSFLTENLDEKSISELMSSCNKHYIDIVLRKEILKYPDIYLLVKNYLLNEFVIRNEIELEIYLKSISIFIENNDMNSLSQAVRRLKSLKSIKINSILGEQIRKYEWIIKRKGNN